MNGAFVAHDNLWLFPNRLGRHGKVLLTIPSQGFTDEQKFIHKGEAPGTNSLFDIDPKTFVFFVGGVPADVKVKTERIPFSKFLCLLEFLTNMFLFPNQLPPPLSLAPFVGCIELSSLNNGIISLYNFKETHNMNVDTAVPCARYSLHSYFDLVCKKKKS